MAINQMKLLLWYAESTSMLSSTKYFFLCIFFYLKQVSPRILIFSMRVRFSLFINVLGEIAKPSFILLGNDSISDSISVKSSSEDATTSFVHSQPLVVMIWGHINQIPQNAPRIKKKKFLIINNWLRLMCSFIFYLYLN